MKNSKLIINTFILTASSFLIRVLGLIFKIFISNKIGAEGVGLFQLIFSVYFLFITIATGGISLGVTRMVSESLACGNSREIRKIMRKCMLFSFVVGFICMIFMYNGSSLLCNFWIRDKRCIDAVKVLAISLPFLAMSSCIKGYFVGIRHIMKSSSVQVFEQVSRILIVVFFITLFMPSDMSVALKIISFGDTFSEIIAFIILLSLYLGERKNNNKITTKTKFSPVKKLLNISTPILTSSLTRALLSSYENILIPNGLEKNGLLRENALGKYGALKGMTMPILFFPSSLLSAFSTLLVPEITYYSAKKQFKTVSEIIRKVIKITIILSFFIFVVFFSCGKELGHLIYKSDDVSFFLKVISPLVPLMYLESVVDGMLKAQNQQFYTMKYNLIDSFLRVTLIFILVPILGVWGLVLVMYISNFFTSIACLRRIIKVSNIQFSYVKYMLKPFICAVCCIFVITLTENFIPPLPFVVFSVVFGGLIYFIMLFVMGCMDKGDIMYFKNLLKKK